MKILNAFDKFVGVPYHESKIKMSILGGILALGLFNAYMKGNSELGIPSNVQGQYHSVKLNNDYIPDLVIIDNENNAYAYIGTDLGELNQFTELKNPTAEQQKTIDEIVNK